MKLDGRNSDSGEPSGVPSVQVEWLGLKQLTRYGSVSDRTLRSWISSPVDPLPASKVCGKWLVRKSDFDDYMERHRFKPLETVDVDGMVRDVLKGVADGRQGSKAER